MKYYESYIPAYSFFADFADPISGRTISIKFFNETGRVLFSYPPEIFERALDFKMENIRALTGNNEQEMNENKEIQERLKFFKAHQKKIYARR